MSVWLTTVYVEYPLISIVGHIWICTAALRHAHRYSHSAGGWLVLL